MKTALISVYNKDGIVEFARELVDIGYEILASGGTAKVLSDAGIKVTDVASLVGGGAILGHRVVTLSREIHAGLLARDNNEDRAELKALNIPFIDLVCVDLYPLEEEISKSVNSKQYTAEQARDAVIEKTDIGGPTMLRSAAKARKIVICDPEDRPKVIGWIKNGEPDKEEFINNLCAKVEFVVADYVLASARYHSKGKFDGSIGQEILTAKYGENGWQTPAGLYASKSADALSLAEFKLVAGTPPSYNNFADVDRLLQTITHIAAGFDVNGIALSVPQPHSGHLPQRSPHSCQAEEWGPRSGGRSSAYVPKIAVGVKHGNPCGAAVSDDPILAIQKMLEGDLRAIFGGVVMVNFPVNEELAEVFLTHKMAPTTPSANATTPPLKGGDAPRRLLDGIIAPSFTPEAIELMKRKGDKCRFLVNPALSSLSKESLDSHTRFRYVRGGFLKQPNYNFVLDLSVAEKTGELSAEQKSDTVLAWAIGSTSNSNTVTIVKNGMLIGNGVGQQDRVGCCELAIKRATSAGHKTEGAAAYSDSFFPFIDGVKVLADAGISAIFATSGSVRDEEVKKFCADNKISLVMSPDIQARGFFGH